MSLTAAFLPFYGINRISFCSIALVYFFGFDLALAYRKLIFMLE